MAAARIRALTLRDTERILDIDARVTGDRKRSWDNDLWRLIADTTTCFGAEVDGRLVGFVLADARPWEFGNRAPVGWIIMIGVDPDHQGQGIGGGLGDRVLEEFRRLGVTDFKTLVRRGDDGLLAYFKGLGFREADEVVLALGNGGAARRKPSAKKKGRKAAARRRR